MPLNPRQGKQPGTPQVPTGATGQCSGPGGTGPQYNFAQLEGLWINAGG